MSIGKKPLKLNEKMRKKIEDLNQQGKKQIIYYFNEKLFKPS